MAYGAIQVLRNAMGRRGGGGGGTRIRSGQHYKVARSNIISVTRGGWVSNLQKKHLNVLYIIVCVSLHIITYNFMGMDGDGFSLSLWSL